MSVSVPTFPSESSALPPLNSSLRNIGEMLLQSAKQHPHTGVRLISSDDENESVLVTYSALLNEARRILGGLREFSYVPGTNVVLLLERPGDVIPAFWACVLGGYVPCPLAPIRNDPERASKHLSHVNMLLDHPVLVTTNTLRKELPSDVRAIDLDSLRAGRPHDGTPDAQLRDPAAIMLTSGSTDNCKGVVLTHGNILASMAGKAERQQMTARDITLNWIAFDHVAALLEMHMISQYVSAEQLHIEPAAVLTDPLLFLHLIDRYRVSVAFAPNFLLGQINAVLRSANAPYESRIQPLELDLSCLRYIITGGEANVVETGRQFLDMLAPRGMKRNALRPAFGMTETSAASVYSHDFPEADSHREFAAVGLPITGFGMRIVDEHGLQLPPGQPGEFQVRGPMVFSRYCNNEEATRAAFTADGWFRTGDLGRLENGRLSLVGRRKDSIIVNGVNYFSHELEAALEQLEGVEPSFVAAFPTRPQGADTEGLIVAFATTFPPDNERRLYQLTIAIRSTTVLLWGFRPTLIVWLPKSAFPKTSLGKIQRALLRKRLEAGELADYEARMAEVTAHHVGGYVRPQGPTEMAIAEIYGQLFGLDPAQVSATASFFDLGGTSLDIIKLKNRLEQRLDLVDLPLVQILQNPTVWGLAHRKTAGYDPVVPLQRTGDKTPLFCVHPGVGEILIYVSLANYFVNDRPFYALRARGFTEGEDYFKTIPEMVEAYVDAIRRHQPYGPYAIAGYSFGAPIAFEIAKQLESQGEQVGFIACIEETPYLAEPSLRLEGVEGPLHVAYLLGLIDRQQLDELPGLLCERLAAEDPIEYLVHIAPPARLAELDLDLARFRAFAEMSRSLVVLGQSYVPSGSVESLTVFYAQPLHGTKQEWLNDVKRWDGFTRAGNRYLEVAGEHHSVMSKQHVTSFQAVLRAEIDRAMGGR